MKTTFIGNKRLAKLTSNFNEMNKSTPTQSVLSGKNGTVAGVNALSISLERGKALLANGTKLIADSKKLLA